MAVVRGGLHTPYRDFGEDEDQLPPAGAGEPAPSKGSAQAERELLVPQGVEVLI